MAYKSEITKESKEKLKAREKAANAEKNHERNQKWRHRAEGMATVLVLLVTFLVGTKF